MNKAGEYVQVLESGPKNTLNEINKINRCKTGRKLYPPFFFCISLNDLEK